jgi:hypothetical protein
MIVSEVLITQSLKTHNITNSRQMSRQELSLLSFPDKVYHVSEHPFLEELIMVIGNMTQKPKLCLKHCEAYKNEAEFSGRHISIVTFQVSTINGEQIEAGILRVLGDGKFVMTNGHILMVSLKLLHFI